MYVLVVCVRERLPVLSDKRVNEQSFNSAFLFLLTIKKEHTLLFIKRIPFL